MNDLEGLLEPTINALGCELWGIEQISGGGSQLLKIYIDTADGVDLEDCARVSRQISSLLDVEDVISGQYTLEISSPGMGRRLFKLAQYKDWCGANVNITLRQPYEGRRRYKGTLQAVAGEDIILRHEDEEYLLPYEQIEKANVIPEF